MKILVFEYLSGGGCSRDELPLSLAREGLLMLNALVREFDELASVRVTVMVDARVQHQVDAKSCEFEVIGPNDDWLQRFLELVDIHDAVWPIAPEFDAILMSLCNAVEQRGKILLTSGAKAVRVAGDKYLTYELLLSRNVPTIATRRVHGAIKFPGVNIIKAIDGAGCSDSIVVRTESDFHKRVESLGQPERYIVQPHLDGIKSSISCLFKQGRSWLLAVNRQGFDLDGDRYRLESITINSNCDPEPYRRLATSVAQAMPGLWGYAGIDLIETAEEIWVLEVNPRLTTSFAGLKDALGINLAASVLELLHGEPKLIRHENRPVTLNLRTLFGDN